MAWFEDQGSKCSEVKKAVRIYQEGAAKKKNKKKEKKTPAILEEKDHK